eukprot:scaffold214259_cov31-Tisochrysis_lutea.AAC.1
MGGEGRQKKTITTTCTGNGTEVLARQSCVSSLEGGRGEREGERSVAGSERWLGVRAMAAGTLMGNTSNLADAFKDF